MGEPAEVSPREYLFQGNDPLRRSVGIIPP
jgi:hypothetical protein